MDRTEEDGHTDAVVDGAIATAGQSANDGGAAERTAAAARGVGVAGTGRRVGEAHPLKVAARPSYLPHPALAAARVGLLSAPPAVHIETIKAAKGATAADAGGRGAGVVARAGAAPLRAPHDRRGRSVRPPDALGAAAETLRGVVVMPHVSGAHPAATAPKVDHDVVLGPNGVAVRRGHLLPLLTRVPVHTALSHAGQPA